MIADHRLDAASATAWYAIGDPAKFDGVELSYLDGNQAPYLEQARKFTPGRRRMLGIRHRCRRQGARLARAGQECRCMIAQAWLELAERLASRVYPQARRRPTWRVQGRTLAIHEAGHAVALELTGRRCTGATIDGRHAARGAAGQVWTTSRVPRELVAPQAPLERAIFPESRALLACWAAAYLAGRQAECIARDFDPCGWLGEDAPDDREAAFMLSAGFGRMAGSAPRAGCEDLARRMLLAHWDQVEAVAELLLRDKTVTGAAIRAAMRVTEQSRSGRESRPIVRGGPTSDGRGMPLARGLWVGAGRLTVRSYPLQLCAAEQTTGATPLGALAGGTAWTSEGRKGH